MRHDRPHLVGHSRETNTASRRLRIAAGIALSMTVRFHLLAGRLQGPAAWRALGPRCGGDGTRRSMRQEVEHRRTVPRCVVACEPPPPLPAALRIDHTPPWLRAMPRLHPAERGQRIAHPPGPAPVVPEDPGGPPRGQGT